MSPSNLATRLFKMGLAHRYKVVGIKNLTSLVRHLSVIAQKNFIQHSNTPKASRTMIKNPRDHGVNHIGMWYTIDQQISNELFLHGGLKKEQKEMTQILGETSLMIREPAITIMDYIKRSNLNALPNKYLLYGKFGTGKSLTLAHLIHYLYDEEWVIVHVNSPAKWCRLFKEILPSVTRDGFFDHTTDASLYLQHFLSQNGKLLDKLQLTTTQDYIWTQRESTVAGSSLHSLVDFGIQRSKYASDVVYFLNFELKKYAAEGRCKVALVFDGINTFFHPISFYVKDDKTVVPPSQFTLFQAFRQFLQPDWNNGCIIGSLNIEMSTKDRRKSIFPRYLLRKEGWDTLDPFIPVTVEQYSEKELLSAIDYYIETRWLQHPEASSQEGKEELDFVSGRNPYELMNIINAH